MRASSSAVRGPVVSQPERSVSETAAISSSEIAGGWNDRKVFRLDESSGIRGHEAYAVRSDVRPRERLLAVLGGHEDGSRPVGAAPERGEDEARLAVDPRLDAFGHLYAREDARWGDQEAGDRAAHTRLLFGHDELVPERGIERQAVQVDAQHRLDELGVVPPSEARCDLDHLRSVRADAQLRVGRA